MTESYVDAVGLRRSHDANILGVLATGVSDVVVAAVRAGSGLELTQATALLVVAEHPGQSVSDLAAALSLTHSGAVRVVDRMQVASLISRVGGQDGRSIGLVVTDAGRVVVTAVLKARRRALDELLGHISPAQRPAFLDGAKAVVRALPVDRASAHRICRLCQHDTCRGTACPVSSAVTAREDQTTGGFE